MIAFVGYDQLAARAPHDPVVVALWWHGTECTEVSSVMRWTHDGVTEWRLSHEDFDWGHLLTPDYEVEPPLLLAQELLRAGT